ncbi:MAG: S8/S53 family peptidase [Dongiaceae bacterium]
MANFDPSEFQHRIESFRNEYADRGSKFANMDEGLRVVLETKGREAPRRVEDQAKSLTPVEVTVERMFPGSEEEESGDRFDLARFFLLTVPRTSYEVVGPGAYDYAYYLREKMDLASAEPDVPFRGFDDARFLDPCWEPEGMEPDDYAWSLRNMRVPQAWKLAPTKGDGIRVGHPDTGYAKHVDLDDSRLDLSRAYNFIDNNPDAEDPLDYGGVLKSPGHGTATGSVIVSDGDVTPPPPSGIKGGTTPPGRVTGVAPKAVLVPLRAIKSVVRIFSGNVAKAVYRATKTDCHVVSMSLGGLPSRALHGAIRNAVTKQRIVLAAAGNCVSFVVWPARYAESIALAATNISDRPWKGSSNGKKVDVSAPGEFVWCARRKLPKEPPTNIDGGQGTSFATANTAGVAALWLAHFGPDALAENARRNGATVQSTFRSRLRATARVPGPKWDSKNFGAGIIDAENLIAQTPPPFPEHYHSRDYQYFSHITGLMSDVASVDAARQMTELLQIAPGNGEKAVQEFESWGHELLRILLSDVDVFEKTIRYIENESRMHIQELRAMYAQHASKTLANVLLLV